MKVRVLGSLGNSPGNCANGHKQIPTVIRDTANSQVNGQRYN